MRLLPDLKVPMATTLGVGDYPRSASSTWLFFAPDKLARCLAIATCR